ncbi:MAG: heme ABC transporter ATP-binding protein [Pseudomonadota bacterium]
MLEAIDIHVSLSGKHIVKGISIRAEPGHFTSIIGPNGSGKTTLLRALTGEIAYTGTAMINGMDVAASPARELASWRGVLPQSARLSFPFTVYEVVRLGLTMGIHDPERDAERVTQALEAVDLADFAGRFYQELSGGEAQRVQLARVLAQVWEPVFDGRPRCLFLDEPISSLDIKHQIQILTLALDYARAGGCLVAVLHDLNLTAHFSDQVCLINNGRLQASGTVKSVMTKANLETVYDCPMAVGQKPRGQNFSVLPVLDGVMASERTR